MIWREQRGLWGQPGVPGGSGETGLRVGHNRKGIVVSRKRMGKKRKKMEPAGKE